MAHKKYEVFLIEETSIYYYVEATDPEKAEDVARQMFLDGKPDENPASGWSRIKDLRVKEIDP